MSNVEATARERRPYRTLVLNADYRPISTWPVELIPAEDAAWKVACGRADAVELWDGAFIRSPSITLALPKVIALKDFVPIYSKPKYCRNSVLLRDSFRCQYCGEMFPVKDLTLDHVIPRASGGQTEWENILTACAACNKAKRNLPANWSGRKGSGTLRPLKKPRKPTAMELLRAGLRFIDVSIREDFSTWLSWDAELQT